MIKTIEGDILKINRGVIVHGCNAQQVMGSGIALQIKEQFPAAYMQYLRMPMILGQISIHLVNREKFIVNLISQNLYGRDGKRFVNYEAIAEGFERVRSYFSPIRDLPICFPAIGAGLGGGDWEIISTIIDRTIPDDYEKILYVLPKHPR
jgi:O-acetyl-ADP-ribose deacetylase (regulator of RNase III)